MKKQPACQGGSAGGPILESQVDFHIHTIMSACASGEMTMRNIAERCLALGRRAIGISDHVMCPEHVSCIAEDIGEAQVFSSGVPAICIGCELDMIAPGAAAADIGRDFPVDFVCVATNHFQLDHVWRPALLTAPSLVEYWADSAISMTELPRADVWVHPATLGPFDDILGGRTLISFLHPRKRDDLFRSLREAGIAVELRKPPPTPEGEAGHIEFYSLAREAGVKFSIGSDAHRLSALSEAWEGVKDLARKVGFSSADLWLPDRLTRTSSLEASSQDC
jgi:histidinol phosphatase-like PHP family hydrolase